MARPYNPRTGKAYLVESLPQWAEVYIVQLERKAQALQDQIDLLADVTQSSVTWAHGHDPVSEHNIDEHAEVRFWKDREERLYLAVERRTGPYEGLVQVRAAHGRLIIYPHVTNVIHIACEGRRKDGG